MGPRRLKINFVLGFIDKTGGVAVVLEYAWRLGKLGHDVRVYHPLLPYKLFTRPGPSWRRWASRIRKYAANLLESRRGIAWFPHPVDVRAVPAIRSAFIRPADATIATVSPTSYDVAALPADAGSKFYLIQGHETWNGSIDRVHATYKLPLKIIVIAPWLGSLMRDKFGVQPTAEIRNGVDLEFFHPPERRRPGPPSLLMMFHVQEEKGIPDGLAVVRRLREAIPDLVVRMFGMYPFPDKDDYIEYTLDPSRERLAELYRDADVYFSPSRNEGWHLPPMEAMASGCAVVATAVGCIPALREEGEMLVAEPGDRDGMFRLAHAALTDPELRRRISESGSRIIANYGWDKAVARLEGLLAASAKVG